MFLIKSHRTSVFGGYVARSNLVFRKHVAIDIIV